MNDYYKILDISKDAPSEDVKKAYFKLVRKYPPDKYPTEFMKIREAYEVLIDEKTRKQYDAMDSMPDIVRQYIDAGRQALELDENEKAIDLLERVIEVYPHFSVVNSLLGDAYYKNGNSGKSIAIFEKLAATEPNNAGFAGKLAHAYLKRGWHKKAIDKFSHALFLDEDNISLWKGLILSHNNANDFLKVKEVTLIALEVSKRKGWDGFELYYYLIQNDINQRDSQALAIHLEEMKESAEKGGNAKENVAWYLANLGKVLLKYDYVDEAEALINSAFELAPEDEAIKEIKDKADQENHMYHLLNKLKADVSFDQVFWDMFDQNMTKCSDPHCFSCTWAQLSMEMHVIMRYSTYRKQIVRLKTAFPELYQMKKWFFDQVLDERKHENLFFTYRKKLSKMKRENPVEMEDYDTDFDIEEDAEYDGEYHTVQQPVKRDENKVGRNDPCPCGSGKKYKKCCLLKQ